MTGSISSRISSSSACGPLGVVLLRDGRIVGVDPGGQGLQGPGLAAEREELEGATVGGLVVGQVGVFEGDPSAGLGLGQQGVGLDHRVHQAEGESLVGVDDPPGEHQLEGAGEADRAGEEVGPAVAGDQAVSFRR